MHIFCVKLYNNYKRGRNEKKYFCISTERSNYINREDIYITLMNKKIVFSVIYISLLCSVSFALADSVAIPNPLESAGIGTFGDLILKIADAVGKAVASLGTLMIIVAGIFYATSAGNPEGVNKAKAALTYAVIGIVIGLAASGIVVIIKTILGIP